MTRQIGHTAPDFEASGLYPANLTETQLTEPTMASNSPDWRELGVRIVSHDRLDPNTPQTPGMHAEAAVSPASAAAGKIAARSAKIEPGPKDVPHTHDELESDTYS